MKRSRLVIIISICSIIFSFPVFSKEYECGTKYCKKMSSCDEAYYQYKVCGFDNLDRDGDGVPCETICGKGGIRQSKESKKTIADILAKQAKDDEEFEKSQQQKK